MKKMRSTTEPISDERYKIIKEEIKQRASAKLNKPAFRLKSLGDKAMLSNLPSNRQPLLLEDIQDLLLYAMLGSSSPCKPQRWCFFEKVNKLAHTVVLVIEGVCSYTFSSNESRFVKTKSIFSDHLEVVLPNCSRSRLLEELCMIPLTQAQKEKLVKEYGSLEAAVRLNKDHHLIARSMFPIEDESVTDNIALNGDETFPRTRLLLSPLQMMVGDIRFL